MAILKQFVFFLIFLLLGKALALFTPVPAGVNSLILLFIALCLKWVKLEQLDKIGQFLLAISGFILLPLLVKGIAYKDLLMPVFWKWVFIVVVCTLLTMMATAFTVQSIQKFVKKSSQEL